jgi:proteic killer suppression protein
VYYVTISFRDKELRGRGYRNALEDGEEPPSAPVQSRSAFKKLAILNAALGLENLVIPPGNRLESLKGDRAGQHSIRVNDRYRICFVWREGHAYDVEIADYH